MTEIKEAIELLKEALSPTLKPSIAWPLVRHALAKLRTAPEQPPAGEFFPLTCKDMYEVIQECCGLCPWCVGLLGRYIKQESDRLDRSKAEIKKYIEMDKYKSEQIILGTENYNRICKTVEQLKKEISGEKIER